MPVEFLTDDEAAAYGRYAEMPSQADLDCVFFLDDEDLKLVRRHRGDHMRAGFALQPVTVRWLGRFLEDPLDVPDGVLEFVAGKQLGVAELAEVKRYTEREHTRFEHQWEIKKDRGYREFDDAAEEFARWAAARSRATGDGPKAIFTDGLAWLRERDILLPGVTIVARLVAGVVTDTTRQLHEELAAMPDPIQRRALDRLLDVPPGSRLSDLERWRKGPAPRGSGPSLVKYLDRAAEIGGVGLGRLGAEARVPPRRMAELSRYGMTASASLIRRHGDARRLATLVATVRHLEGKSIDDALELLDLNASAQTIRAYRGDLIQFAAHHDGEVGELSAAPVRAYLADIGGLAASTRKRKRAAVASFCKWAVRHDLLGANPMDKIDTVKVPKSLSRPAPAADINRVLNTICSRRPRKNVPLDRLRDRVLFETAYACGARASEVCGLYVEDLDLRLDDEHVRIHGKGGSIRTVLLDDRGHVALLRLYLARTGYTSGPLFRATINGSGGTLSCDAAHHRWQGYCDDTETDIGIHQLRHAHGTELKRRGVASGGVPRTRRRVVM